ncbi:sigma-54-dependent Fis family transcriptional regulator [Legionella taurinensis]|uniref:Sigma-54-dependent Fis family transcriptional regulator n=1 Tax=Legionella taurinensis TaxID=70611 RepID=A0A3A5LJE0_9GAMM|nr:sigma-54 dependent transcriptional regulator [Legionella taurinensis]MDX1836607.1 sigma-54 dependent transcriptional regulator [Legionella taurinensis]PUT42934.1 sigma-54-dependent Fis family transcriptional regulator [Legionella taurinensis]PUT45489.1 sigma-54-dependent Fis family transcriptional regulator [Legionella taurinensis]PUT46936.1 sigma-54-dependent Fis family transcriptional regulator [Legionella taurinensis]PUT49256.1 sigma-54-dependent Fis family transcriptional regulator [Leg
MSDVLIVEDDPVLREALGETMSLAGHSFLAARDGREALAMLERHNPAIVLSDIRMDKMDGQQLLSEIQRRNPGVPVILMTAHGSIDDAVHAMRQGAVDYLQKPFSAHTLTEKINHYIKPLSMDDSEPIAQDPKSQALMSMALRVAQSDVGVMISGESGTGKEVLAHFIHDHSPRREHPFIAINCAAIPEQMLEATLFGYEKGSFTGAYKSTPGKFEQAQGGTLLLDEVSEMSLGLQAKLLRVLQEKEVERIGANKMISLDVRVLATSNRQLLDEVKAGRFREDLFYRLNVFPLHWLPLRERPNDIIPLANYLIRRHCQNNLPVTPVLSDKAKQALLRYAWPGNARELDNVVQRALVLQTQNVIETEHLQLPDTAVSGTKKEVKNLQNHEFDLIEQILKEHQGNRQQVAAILGVSERTLRYKLARMREEGYVV